MNINDAVGPSEPARDPETSIAVLIDGPPDLSHIVPISSDALSSGRLAVDYRASHLHFCATGERQFVGGRIASVFRWSYTTAIAE